MVAIETKHHSSGGPQIPLPYQALLRIAHKVLTLPPSDQPLPPSLSLPHWRVGGLQQTFLFTLLLRGVHTFWLAGFLDSKKQNVDASEQLYHALCCADPVAGLQAVLPLDLPEPQTQINAIGRAFTPHWPQSTVSIPWALPGREL